MGDGLTKKDVQEAVSKAFDDKLDSIGMISRETHHAHHEFIASLIKLFDTVQNTALKSFVKLIVWGLLLTVLSGIFYFTFIKQLPLIKLLK